MVRGEAVAPRPGRQVVDQRWRLDPACSVADSDEVTSSDYGGRGAGRV